MPFFIISHFFLIKVSLDIKMGLCFLEKNCHRISEIFFLPSLKAKLLFPVCDGIPCIMTGDVAPQIAALNNRRLNI